VGELGEVIKLLQGARARYRTLQGEVRSWTDGRVFMEAVRRHSSRDSRESARGMAPIPGPPSEPETTEETSRFWIENPSRYRIESSTFEGGTWMEIGRRFWLEPDRPSRYPIPPDSLPLEKIYDPALLIAELWLEAAGRMTFLGRDGIVVHATPRPTMRAGGMEFLVIHDPPGDEYELVVDATLGIVLRLEGRMEGEMMTLDEVTDLAVDQPIEEGLLENDDDG
jgi:hypothetical protein